MKQFMENLKQNPWLLAIGLAVLVIIWMVSGMGGNSIDEIPLDASNIADEIPTVRVEMQQAVPVIRRISIYGRVEPARTVTLAAETTGRVVAVAAKRGAQVAENELIVQLDIRDREAQLKRAKADIEKARIKYAAEQRLKTEAFASETRLAEAIAELEAARAQYKNIEIDIANTQIRAPFGGALQDRFVEIGDYVAPGDPVGEFVDTNTLIVTGTIAENERAWVQVGESASADLVTGETATGTIRYIAPVADQATRTFAIELEIDNTDGQLPAGVTAELKLQAGEVLAHRISPAILTLNDDGDIGIKTVELSIVEFHEIEIVQSGDDGIWIAGLPVNANIITVGQGFVKPGERVNPQTSEAEIIASEGAQQ